MKLARWTKNYTQLDEAIKELGKFLYNGGDGKKVPITELVQIRNKDRETNIKISKDKQKKANDLAMIDMRTGSTGKSVGISNNGAQ
nr:hypothetical protein BaRGS_016214 [Batillaria attramentaria]